jgi:hypothetical protein
MQGDGTGRQDRRRWPSQTDTNSHFNPLEEAPSLRQHDLSDSLHPVRPCDQTLALFASAESSKLNSPPLSYGLRCDDQSRNEKMDRNPKALLRHRTF